MKLKITVDSTCDIDEERKKKYDILSVPLTLSLGDELALDDENMTSQKLFDFVERTKKLPKTSAVNEEQYKQVFQSVFDEGYDAIIHLPISSEMSVCYQNAVSASKLFENVFVVDSKTLANGIALLAMYARELADTGKYNAKQIASMVEERTNKVNTSFLVKDIEFLWRGGRCSTVAMLGANIFHIKPSIEIVDKKLVVAKKYMGNYNVVAKKFVKDVLTKYNNPDYSRIYIEHTDTDPKLVAEIMDYIKTNTKFREVIEGFAGSTITCHCGHSVLGIFYLNDGEHPIE